MSTWQPSGVPRSEIDPVRVGESLDRVTRRLGAPSSSVLTAVFSGWEEIVGPEIAVHARPKSLHDGILVIAVDQPAWATQLRFMSADLLQRIRATAGGSDVSEIQVKVSSEPFSERAGRGRKPG